MQQLNVHHIHTPTRTYTYIDKFTTVHSGERPKPCTGLQCELFAIITRPVYQGNSEVLDI